MFLRNVALAHGESNVLRASIGACHKRDDLSHFSALEEECLLTWGPRASETALLFSKAKARPDLQAAASAADSSSIRLFGESSNS